MGWLVLLGFALGLAVIWVAAFLGANDLAVPTRRFREPLRTMAIFPHADDETVTAGGTFGVVTQTGGAVALVLLTWGERGGTPGGSPSDLAEARHREANRAAHLLGIGELLQGDFPDGALEDHGDQVSTWLAQQIEAWRPELLITYDRAGLYGHPDHVACAGIVTQLRDTRFPNIALWYSSLPPRLARNLTRVRVLPAAAPGDPRRSQPTHKVFVGQRLIAKMRAWSAYRSQRQSLRKGAGRFVPPWLFLSVLLFEYFAEAIPLEAGPRS